MPFLNECDIINDENARLRDRSQVLDDAFRVEQPVAAAIEGPGAAERAVPRATARELALGIRVRSGYRVMPLSWSFSLPAIHPPAYDQQRTNEARQRDDKQEGVLAH